MGRDAAQAVAGGVHWCFFSGVEAQRKKVRSAHFCFLTFFVTQKMDTPDASIPAVGGLQRRKMRVRVRGGEKG